MRRLGSTLSRFAFFLLFFVVAASPCAAQFPGTFARTGNMLTSRSQHTATLLPSGKVLLTGGITHDNGSYAGRALAGAEMFDPASGTFSATANMRGARRMHSATLLPDGRVLIAGGYDDVSPLATAELYDPNTGTFVSAGTMQNTRGGHDAILLRNGTVLIIGGFDGRYPLIPMVEIYDPVEGTFTTVASSHGPAVCDFCAPSVLLADGRILFPYSMPPELYDPATRTFSVTGAPNRFESAATLLMNGRVLLTGGEDVGRSNQAELYDPTTGTFTLTGNMAVRRVWHSQTLLPDGTVLTVGGETDDCNANSCIFAGSTPAAEVYNPATGSFAATSSMATSREGHSATLLNDGRVLIAGGVAYGGIGVFFGSTVTAELYTPAYRVASPLAISTRTTVSAGDTLAILCRGLPEHTIIPPQIVIGGQMAEVVSFDAAPSWPGIVVIRVRVPGTLRPGPVAMRVSYMSRVSNEIMLVAR